MVLETIAIKTVFGKALDLVKAVPREVWYAFAAAALLWWIDSRAYDRGYGERTAEYEAHARLAQERARRADVAAGETVTQTQNDVETSNEQARDAATNSDDPLADGLRSLRP